MVYVGKVCGEGIVVMWKKGTDGSQLLANGGIFAAAT
jgi:hypothetical protein